MVTCEVTTATPPSKHRTSTGSPDRVRGDATRFVRRDTVSDRFRKLLRKLNINGRPGLVFYTLRHVFQTIGGEAKDPEAVAAIMGHVDSSMGAVYRERISDERLRDVVETVRRWLWPDDTGGEEG